MPNHQIWHLHVVIRDEHMQFLKNIDSLRAKKDILIFKKFVKDHNIVLRKVLAVLDESGMT